MVGELRRRAVLFREEETDNSYLHWEVFLIGCEFLERCSNTVSCWRKSLDCTIEQSIRRKSKNVETIAIRVKI